MNDIQQTPTGTACNHRSARYSTTLNAYLRCIDPAARHQVKFNASQLRSLGTSPTNTTAIHYFHEH